MPIVYITTNVNLNGVDADPVFSDATKAVAAIIGRPEYFVMVLLKGAIPISFNGNKDPAAFVEVVSMGGLNTEVKRKLIVSLGTILENRLSIPKTRFVLKIYDTTAAANASKL